MSPNLSAALAEPATPVDLGMAYRTLIVSAPHAPRPLLDLCAHVLANPRTCSDAVLLVSDALREMSDAVHATSDTLHALKREGRVGTTAFLFLSALEIVALSQLSAAMADQAPSRAGTCRP